MARMPPAGVARAMSQTSGNPAYRAAAVARAVASCALAEPGAGSAYWGWSEGLRGRVTKVLVDTPRCPTRRPRSGLESAARCMVLAAGVAGVDKVGAGIISSSARVREHITRDTPLGA